jgi:hemolysin III
MRGILHVWALLIALPIGGWLVWSATPEARWPLSVFALSQVLLLAVSGTYHRGRFNPTVRRWMRRLDHSMIFGLIAGTMTPLAMLGCTSEPAFDVLRGVWAAAACGVLMKLLWIDAPTWLSTAVYILVGAAMFLVLPEVYRNAGMAVIALIAFGSVVHVLGGVVYVVEKPNPVPGVFGYHEVFHGCTLVGFSSFFAAVALLAAG